MKYEKCLIINQTVMQTLTFHNNNIFSSKKSHAKRNIEHTNEIIQILFNRIKLATLFIQIHLVFLSKM